MTKSNDPPAAAEEQTGGINLYRQLGGAAALMPPSTSFTVRSYPIAESPPFRGSRYVSPDRQTKGVSDHGVWRSAQLHGSRFATRHRHLVARGLNDSHFDAVVELLGESLMELGVAPALIAQVAVIAESTRNDVLNR